MGIITLFIKGLIGISAAYASGSECPDLQGTYHCPDQGWDRGEIRVTLERQGGLTYYRWFKPAKNQTELYLIAPKPRVASKKGSVITLVSHYCEDNQFLSKTEWLDTSVPTPVAKYQELVRHAFINEHGDLVLSSELWFVGRNGQPANDHLLLVCPRAR